MEGAADCTTIANGLNSAVSRFENDPAFGLCEITTRTTTLSTSLTTSPTTTSPTTSPTTITPTTSPTTSGAYPVGSLDDCPSAITGFGRIIYQQYEEGELSERDLKRLGAATAETVLLEVGQRAACVVTDFYSGVLSYLILVTTRPVGGVSFSSLDIAVAQDVIASQIDDGKFVASAVYATGFLLPEELPEATQAPVDEPGSKSAAFIIGVTFGSLLFLALGYAAYHQSRGTIPGRGGGGFSNVAYGMPKDHVVNSTSSAPRDVRGGFRGRNTHYNPQASHGSAGPYVARGAPTAGFRMGPRGYHGSRGPIQTPIAVNGSPYAPHTPMPPMGGAYGPFPGSPMTPRPGVMMRPQLPQQFPFGHPWYRGPPPGHPAFGVGMPQRMPPPGQGRAPQHGVPPPGHPQYEQYQQMMMRRQQQKLAQQIPPGRAMSPGMMRWTGNNSPSPGYHPSSQDDLAAGNDFNFGLAPIDELVGRGRKPSVRGIAEIIRLTSEELEKLSKMMQASEKDGDGVVTKEEFMAIWGKLHDGNFADTQGYADKVFAVFDADHNGVIGTKEFMSFAAIASEASLEMKLGAVFKVFDEDDSGSLSHSEVAKMITIIANLDKSDDHTMSPENLAEMIFMELDSDGGGEIELKEWAALGLCLPLYLCASL